MITSRFASLIDSLVAAVNATAPVFTVFDGPAATDQGWTDACFIGFDADWAGNFESVVIDQAQATMGTTTRYEDLKVTCAAVAWSGSLEPKATRDRAAAVLAGVETVLRTDPTVGMGAAAITTLQVGAVYQEPFPEGHSCRILFTVHQSNYLP